MLAGASAELLHPKVREVAGALGYKRLLPVQEKAVPVILSGSHALVTAPTGSGKTEAALFPVLSMLLREIEEKGDLGGVRVVYVTPLRSLNRDVTLRIGRIVEGVGLRVQLRHGDTTPSARKRFLKTPPHVMVTTPESLSLLLTVGDRSLWGRVKWVIVDEVHELIDSKRGSELSVVLERLESLSRYRVQRIGLSATLSEKSAREAAKLLAYGRRVSLVVDDSPKEYSVGLSVVEASAGDESLWAKSVEEILRLASTVEGSVLVFTNTRSTAEKLASSLAKAARERGLPYRVEVHHGSLSRSVREGVERDFREGRVKILVATSSMELGIDIGSVDLVVQFMSPRQVLSMVQRAGRAGHRFGEVSRAHIVTLDNMLEVLESGVIALRAERGHLEDQRMHEKPYDVAAHQAAGMVIERGGEASVGELHSIMSSSGGLAGLTEEELGEVLEHLDSVRVLRFDPSTGIARYGRRTRTYFYRVSMIPDENTFTVYNVATGERIGEVSERFVETRLLDVRDERELRFVLGGRVWQAVSIDYEKGRIDAVLLGDAPGLVPAWEGELIPVDYKVAREVCGVMTVCMSDEGDCLRLLAARKIRGDLAERIARELRATAEALGGAFSRGEPMVEETRGAAILYACLGSKGNLGLALLVSRILEREKNVRVEFHYTPYAIIFTSPVGVKGSDVAWALERAASWDRVERLVNVMEAARSTRTYTIRLSWVAKRMGVIEPGKRVHTSLLRKLASALRDTVVDREALKEILHDKIDMDAVNEFLDALERVRVAKTREPTPLATHVVENPYVRLDAAVHIKQIAMDKIVESIKRSMARKSVRLLCLNCGRSTTVTVGSLGNRLSCSKCGSRTLAPLPDTEYGERLASAYARMKRGEKLAPAERKLAREVLERAKLLLSYSGQGAGRYVVEALMTYGVGVERAKRILVALFERGERGFYDELLKAMQDYAYTRQFWEKKGRRG